jgi:hypothetical protein
MGAPAVPVNPLTNSVGFNIRRVTITQVDLNQGIALAVDEQNVQVTVPILWSRAKGRLPAEGDSWLIDQSMGFWALSFFLGKSANDFKIISGQAGGRRIELDEDGLRYYRSNGDLLVDINTTTDDVRVQADFPHPFTLQSGWINNTAPGTPLASYWRLPFGAVQITGNIKNGTSASGTVLATLPEGYRPNYNHSFPVYVNKSPAAGSDVPNITVLPNGQLQLFGAAALGTTGQVIFDFICPITV